METREIVLKSDALTVQIAAPGTVYRGTRFDWSGFITQVTLDGRHTFCVSEALDGTGTGGQGLCNEFGIFDPVGYDEVKAGEWFPKLGVGLLQREDAEPYRFSRPSPLKPFPVQVSVEGSRAVFVCEPLPCRGYAARVTKAVAVEGARLSVGCYLENLGEKPLRTSEYCHNFLAFDRQTIGPDYTLRLPFMTEGRVTAPLSAWGQEITWIHTPERAFYFPMEDEHSEGTKWELTHRPSGLAMSETVTPGWFKLTLWGTERVVSPEAFVRIDVAPGETKSWQRDFVFRKTGAGR